MDIEPNPYILSRCVCGPMFSMDTTLQNGVVAGPSPSKAMDCLVLSMPCVSVLQEDDTSVRNGIVASLHVL